MENLKYIITELQRLRGETQLLLVDDVTIFQEAVKIFLTDKIQINKEKNMEKMKENKAFIKATDKQIAYIQHKTGKIPSNLTKEEASRIISDLKACEI